MGGFKPTGVNPRLVEKVRGALDDAGYPDVRIVASGGFTAERIQEFESTGRPGRRLRRRLVADPRRQRLHGRRRLVDGRPEREGRAHAIRRTRGSRGLSNSRAVPMSGYSP